jgi:hypothetical protein
MKSNLILAAWLFSLLSLLLLFPVSAPGAEPAAGVSPAKAELMGRVEDFFLHNFRDVSWRKSLEWGDVQAGEKGARSIRYTYEARVWDKETLTMSQVFTFAADGKFLEYKNVEGFPRKKEAKAADVSSQKGMIALVEEFFSQNYRDITARKTIEWGQVAKDEKGNPTIRYKYEATIWNKDKKVIEQIFTFDPKGEFVSVKSASAEKEQQPSAK